MELWLGRAGACLVGAALVGQIVRHRWRLWYAFALLLLIVLAHDGLVSLWPAQFHRNHIWRAKEMTLIVVRVAMVVEITIRVFRRFPGAMATARVLLIVIAATSTLAAVFTLPVRQTGHAEFVGNLMPRVLNGTIWLFAGLAILILWYRLPVHWFQKAILLSYVPYLLVFTLAMNALGEMGWQRAAWADWLSVLAYFFLLLFWNYAAWRREPSRPPSAGPPDAA